MSKSVFFLLLVFLSLRAHAKYEKVSFDTKKIKQLNLMIPSGNLIIYASLEDKKIIIEFEKIRFPKSCRLDFKQKRNQLITEVIEKRSGYDDESCLINCRIRLPEFVNIDVINGFGDLKVLGMKGALKYLIGSGDIELSGDYKQINGKVGNGKQVLRGYSQQTNLESGRGDFDLDLDQARARDVVHLKSGTGNATVLLPKLSEVDVRLQSGLGRLFNEFENIASKPVFTIRMRSGTGGLRVKKAEK